MAETPGRFEKPCYRSRLLNILVAAGLAFLLCDCAHQSSAVNLSKAPAAAKPHTTKKSPKKPKNKKKKKRKPDMPPSGEEKKKERKQNHGSPQKWLHDNLPEEKDFDDYKNWEECWRDYACEIAQVLEADSEESLS